MNNKNAHSFIRVTLLSINMHQLPQPSPTNSSKTSSSCVDLITSLLWLGLQRLASPPPFKVRETQSSNQYGLKYSLARAADFALMHALPQSNSAPPATKTQHKNKVGDFC